MPKKKTTEQFIADARKVHGDKYDYSLVDYKGSNVYVKIICPIHGVFEQKAGCHIQGQGCAACSGTKKKTQEEFIAHARRVHGDKYGYDRAVYVNDSTKVTITCPKHGDFQITPDSFLHSKSGCQKCGIESRVAKRTMSQEEFIRRARLIHRDKYSYDKVVYRDSHFRVTIVCPEHGDFIQLPYQHLNGNGCRQCATAITREKESIKVEEFISRSRECHTIMYDYSKVEMRGMQEEVYIICPKHGGFWQTANSHVQGCDCPKCAYESLSLKKTKTTEQFIEDAKRIHGDEYDYSETIYSGVRIPVAIRCRKCNMTFWQKPMTHLQGCGCPMCSQSRLESEMLLFLKNQNIRFEKEKTFDWLKSKGSLFIDYFLPDYGVAIECQGIQHFDSFEYFGGEDSYEETKKRDHLKKQLCEAHDIRVLYYSNLGINYPYPVIESKELLLKAIMEKGIVDDGQWKIPELPLAFE